MKDYSPITSFTGQHFFLSNFYLRRFAYPLLGVVESAEHAYQASKGFYSVEPDMVNKILAAPSAAEAKKLGRALTLDDVSLWDKRKVNVMRDIIHYKFKGDNELRWQLRNTSPRLLVEGNTWGDRIWGQVNGVGCNLLGVLLMEERASI